MKKDLLRPVVSTIVDGYEQYISDFNQITREIPENFIKRDWKRLQENHKKRLRLYKDHLASIVAACRKLLGEQITEDKAWKILKSGYLQEVSSRGDKELAATFFNSVFRKTFPGNRIDEQLMFVEAPFSELPEQTDPYLYRTYTAGNNLHLLFQSILDDFDFGTGYFQKEEDIRLLIQEVEQVILSRYRITEATTTQVLQHVFYRNKAAYLIGRISLEKKWMPFIIPFVHNRRGVFADTLIFDPNIMSGIFSYTRSYFMTPVYIPSQTVAFLNSVIPHKKPYELYNAIGFNKHGKTSFYRDFTRHLRESEDEFVPAPGIRGMVMTVFTLPSYNIVFKLIKDHFDPPKNMTRQQVREKYKLVGLHDRVGRMADTHEFENFKLPLHRIHPELMKELKNTVNSLLKIEGNTLVIRHLYIERRLTPLNIFLDSCSLKLARLVVNDYAKAILQMAQANIFPGDMMTKNFGVTRQNRVIFYDYDEIEFLDSMNFRSKPKAETYEQIYSSEPWYDIGEKDVFPEDFKRFMIGRSDVKDFFIQSNPELFDPEYWKKIQDRLKKGEFIHAFPYPENIRFRPEQEI